MRRIVETKCRKTTCFDHQRLLQTFPSNAAAAAAVLNNDLYLK